MRHTSRISKPPAEQNRRLSPAIRRVCASALCWPLDCLSLSTPRGVDAGRAWRAAATAGGSAPEQKAPMLATLYTCLLAFASRPPNKTAYEPLRLPVRRLPDGLRDERRERRDGSHQTDWPPASCARTPNNDRCAHPPTMACATTAARRAAVAAACAPVAPTATTVACRQCAEPLGCGPEQGARCRRLDAHGGRRPGPGRPLRRSPMSGLGARVLEPAGLHVPPRRGARRRLPALLERDGVTVGSTTTVAKIYQCDRAAGAVRKIFTCPLRGISMARPTCGPTTTEASLGDWGANPPGASRTGRSASATGR